MSQFDNVSIVKQANLYFEGRVSSRELHFADGSRKTLGIMMPGDYEFGTEQAELMEILAGVLEIRLPGQSEWQQIVAGQTFNVPANASFSLRIKQLTDYCCSYL
jgi:uncharacterized protein YaiE (UPF0345 family)